MLIAELKSFYAVARCGTVTKAAAQLGVSQPTVTEQLRQLESRYGVELFHRQGRGMRLSDTGHSLMPMVEKLAWRGKVAMADLADHALLLREPGSMTRQLTEEALQAAGVNVKRTLEIGSRESIRQAIRCELGISLIPSREIPSHPELAALDIEGAEILMHKYLYCLLERQPVQLIARFLEMAPAAG